MRKISRHTLIHIIIWGAIILIGVSHSVLEEDESLLLFTIRTSGAMLVFLY